MEFNRDLTLIVTTTIMLFLTGAYCLAIYIRGYFDKKNMRGEIPAIDIKKTLPASIVKKAAAAKEEASVRSMVPGGKFARTTNSNNPEGTETVYQPNLEPLSLAWEAIKAEEAITTIGIFEIFVAPNGFFKWRIVSEDKTLLLTSHAEYTSEKTYIKGIEAAIRSLSETDNKRQFLSVFFIRKEGYKLVLKSKNNKIIGVGPFHSLKSSAKEKLETIQDLSRKPTI